MRIRSKPPNYIQNRRDAARLKNEREINKKFLISINRVADALESTKIQEHTDDNSRARREKLTIRLLIATLICTGLAVIEAHRLVDSTNDAIRKADDAAKIQHTDTIAALAKAEAANQNANRLIAANEKLASVNRSIVFVSAHMDDTKPKVVNNLYIAKVYFSLLNKGTLPASIIDVKTDLYMGHSWVDYPINLDSPDSLKLIGRSNEPSLCQNGTIIDEGAQAQLIIDAHAVFGECQRNFIFFDRKEGEDTIQGVIPLQGDRVLARVFWFHVIIKYRDITGTEGETSYLAAMRGKSAEPIDPSRNYQK